MDVIEIAKTVLSEMVETARKDVVTEGIVAQELVKHGFDFQEAIDCLKNVYKDAGVEKKELYSGKIICYYKPEKESDQQETVAVKMAKEAAQSNVNERKAAAIISSYRR